MSKVRKFLQSPTTHTNTQSPVNVDRKDYDKYSRRMQQKLNEIGGAVSDMRDRASALQPPTKLPDPLPTGPEDVGRWIVEAYGCPIYTTNTNDRPEPKTNVVVSMEPKFDAPQGPTTAELRAQSFYYMLTYTMDGILYDTGAPHFTVHASIPKSDEGCYMFENDLCLKSKDAEVVADYFAAALIGIGWMINHRCIMFWMSDNGKLAAGITIHDPTIDPVPAIKNRFSDPVVSELQLEEGVEAPKQRIPRAPALGKDMPPGPSYGKLHGNGYTLTMLIYIQGKLIPALIDTGSPFTRLPQWFFNVNGVTYDEGHVDTHGDDPEHLRDNVTYVSDQTFIIPFRPYDLDRKTLGPEYDWTWSLHKLHHQLIDRERYDISDALEFFDITLIGCDFLAAFRCRIDLASLTIDFNVGSRHHYSVPLYVNELAMADLASQVGGAENISAEDRKFYYERFIHTTWDNVTKEKVGDPNSVTFWQVTPNHQHSRGFSTRR